MRPLLFYNSDSQFGPMFCLPRFYRSCTRLWHTALTDTAAGECFANN